MVDEVVIIKSSKASLTVAFIAGALIGGYTAAALVRKAMQEQMSEQIEEEFSRLRAQYVGSKPWSSPTEAVQELHPEEMTDGKAVISGFGEITPREHVAYEKIREFKPNDTAPDEAVVEIEPMNIVAEEEFEIIAPEVFIAAEHGYVQESLSYYPMDNVCTDPRDNKIENHEKFLGPKFQTYFGSGDDPYTVCVRNNKLQIDYEVTLMNNGSYERDVAGLTDDSTEPQTDRQRINGV